MLINRFADTSFASTQRGSITLIDSFVPLPILSFAFQQQLAIAAIYQFAAKLTNQQLQPSRPRLLQFSMN